MSDKFITESEVERQKKKRQEEWEKVRTEDQPKEAPEPEVDNRSLYDRLKTEREKVEAEKAETKSLKNLVRGLDTEEAGFLDFVDNMKVAEMNKQQKEEQEIFSQIKSTVLEAAEPTSSVAGPSRKRPAGPSRQAQLLGAAIKRKSSESTESDPKTAKRPDEAVVSQTLPDSTTTCAAPSALGASVMPKNGALVDLGRVPTAMTAVGVLPGFCHYDDSGTDSDNSDSSAGSSPNDTNTTSQTTASSVTASDSGIVGTTTSSVRRSVSSSGANRSNSSHTTA